MASIFSSIFSMFSGGSAGQPAATVASGGEPEAYGDCMIYAEPIKESGQYRLAGRITKQVGDEVLVRSFIRADLFSSTDDAMECTLRKARQIIDQNGPSLFSDGQKQRQV